MIALVNYSNPKFRKAQKVNTWSGIHIAKFDKVFEYTEKDIDKEYFEKHRNILEVKRGGGLWLWKPYIILDALGKAEDGDVIFYCDSGALFSRNIKNEFLSMPEDIWVSELPLIEKQFSKADAFVVVGCLEREYWESNQVQGSFVAVRKNNNTVHFIEEWLHYCEDERVVSLNPNVMGVENDLTFISNREDQTALSLLCKKRKIIPHADPSQYGKVPEAYLRLPGVLLNPKERAVRERPFIILFRSPSAKATIIIKQTLLLILPRNLSLAILKRIRKESQPSALGK